MKLILNLNYYYIKQFIYLFRYIKMNKIPIFEENEGTSFSESNTIE